MFKKIVKVLTTTLRNKIDIHLSFPLGISQLLILEDFKESIWMLS